jgi:multicomponent K+:H+ antiporter subunit D
MIMQALKDAGSAPGVWAALLISGLIVGLVMARAGSTFFWEAGGGLSGDAPSDSVRITPRGSTNTAAALIATVAGAVLVTLTAAPISDYARSTADQLALPASYVGSILGQTGTVPREHRP